MQHLQAVGEERALEKARFGGQLDVAGRINSETGPGGDYDERTTPAHRHGGAFEQGGAAAPRAHQHAEAGGGPHQGHRLHTGLSAAHHRAGHQEHHGGAHHAADHHIHHAASSEKHEATTPRRGFSEAERRRLADEAFPVAFGGQDIDAILHDIRTALEKLPAEVGFVLVDEKLIS